MLYKRSNKAPSVTSASKWMALVIIILFSAPSLAQDKQPINNKGTIKQTRAKSVKKKEKASTKDIAGRRLRTKNANSAAGRAVYSNPSPYADERRGKDRAAKPIGGKPARIRSRSAESARNNVYPQRGQFVNWSSERTSKTERNQGPPRSRTRSAESSRSNVYPQKGPFVNRSSTQTERPAAKSRFTRKGKLSTNARATKNVRVGAPRSQSTSAESAKGKRFKQTGPFVNRSSKSGETVAAGSSRYTRRGKLSAGPNPPGKKKTITPRSSSQQYVTRGKKDVYWGKFSKGEKAITTDVSGNPLRKRNFRTPPNEIIKPKDPYAGRKRSSGDRAYSGTFRSGHVSRSKRTESPWKGDVSGRAIRKRSERQNQIVGERVGAPKMLGGLSAKMERRFNGPRGIKPEKGAGGSVSGKYRSNKPLGARVPGEGASAMMRGQSRTTGIKPQKGGGGSISGKYQSNKPIGARVPGIGASTMMRGQSRITGIKPQKGGGGSVSGKYQSNKPIGVRVPGIGASTMMRGQSRITGIKPQKGGGGSVSGKYQSNKPIGVRVPGSIGASSVRSYQNRLTGIKPDKGGGGSVSGKYQSNKPIGVRVPGSIGASSVRSYQNRLTGIKPDKGGGGSVSGKYQSNKPIGVRVPGSIGASSVRSYQNRLTGIKPDKGGGGSMSGKTWNNNGQPILGRVPGAQAAAVGYSGKTKLPFFRKAYVRNPNADEQALKKLRPDESVYMADKLQVEVKARQTGNKPKAVKGSMPGLAPTKATVKASEYSSSMKVYWSYKHNPSSADESQKTIAPTKSFMRAASYSGRTRLTKNYRHNPVSDKEALKVIAPGRAYARITDYQGNIKMGKYNDKRFLPDAKFAHMRQNNVKQERTIMTDFKLLWTKIFKKNGTQPNAVKEKSVRPRYDKRERELWPGLYD